MSRPLNVPSYRSHRQSGQAIVTQSAAGQTLNPIARGGRKNYSKINPGTSGHLHRLGVPLHAPKLATSDHLHELGGVSPRQLARRYGRRRAADVADQIR